MAKEKIEPDQEQYEEKPLSLFAKKMKILLGELDEHLEQIGGDYGPILMEDLQSRLEHVVNKFNDDVHNMFTESFKKWNITDSQVREFVNSSIKIPDNKADKNNNGNSLTPKFIKDVKFGPIRPK
jgi:hypothetical protein